jgi:purine nucleosidase
MRIIVDTDIGTDDAVALLLALKTANAHVEAITTVAGNTDVDSCVRNAAYVQELCGTNIPVFRGAAVPLAGRRHRRQPVHGDDGLGGLGLRPRRPPQVAGAAVPALIQLIRGRPREVTLVTLGPLTNIGLALRDAPDLASAVRATVVMGGAIDGGGTATAVAEFNIWADPEAARIVLGSGMPVTLVDIAPSRGPCALDASDVARLAATDTAAARFVAAMCGAGSREGAAGLPDAIAMAVALVPPLVIASSARHVEVDTTDSATRGQTTVDSGDPRLSRVNVKRVEEVDAIAYKDLLFAACS